jgi:hypothetical protein
MAKEVLSATPVEGSTDSVPFSGTAFIVSSISLVATVSVLASVAEKRTRYETPD